MINQSNSFQNARGKIEYTLTNDYMFRSVLQTNTFVLKGLICSLLHLKSKEVKSVTILNPIELGKEIKDKNFILDIKVLLNNNSIINLEMQVRNEFNWPDRSLSYLCRTFDNLKKGNDYTQIKPTFHIGILDFTLFPEHPEFYATYKMMNLKKHYIFNDKFTLNVLDLNQIQLATEEDFDNNIVYWAKLFKAKTWEELIMLSEKNEYMSEATKTLYTLSKEDEIRNQCEAREDYERTWNGVKRMMAEKDKTIAELKALVAKLQNESSQK